MELQLGQRLQAYKSFGQFEALTRVARELGKQAGGWNRQQHPKGQNAAATRQPQRAQILSTPAASTLRPTHDDAVLPTRMCGRVASAGGCVGLRTPRGSSTSTTATSTTTTATTTPSCGRCGPSPAGECQGAGQGCRQLSRHVQGVASRAPSQGPSDNQLEFDVHWADGLLEPLSGSTPAPGRRRRQRASSPAGPRRGRSTRRTSAIASSTTGWCRSSKRSTSRLHPRQLRQPRAQGHACRGATPAAVRPPGPQRPGRRLVSAARRAQLLQLASIAPRCTGCSRRGSRAAACRLPPCGWFTRCCAARCTPRCRCTYPRPADRAHVPPHKRLENAPPGCGLPIGNLVSQFFANVYLDAPGPVRQAHAEGSAVSALRR